MGTSSTRGRAELCSRLQSNLKRRDNFWNLSVFWSVILTKGCELVHLGQMEFIGRLL